MIIITKEQLQQAIIQASTQREACSLLKISRDTLVRKLIHHQILIPDWTRLEIERRTTWNLSKVQILYQEYLIPGASYTSVGIKNSLNQKLSRQRVQQLFFKYNLPSKKAEPLDITSIQNASSLKEAVKQLQVSRTSIYRAFQKKKLALPKHKFLAQRVSPKLREELIRKYQNLEIGTKEVGEILHTSTNTANAILRKWDVVLNQPGPRPRNKNGNSS